MTLLYSQGLYLLLLLLPLIILFMLRMPRKRLDIATTAIWERIIPDAARQRRRLRTILSYVLQALLLILAAWACARPYLSKGAEKRNLVLVMDCSASMQATDVKGTENRFEAARTAALELVKEMGLGDRALVIRLAHTADILANFEPDPVVVRRALANLSPLDTRTNIAPVANLLSEVARGFDGVEIHFFTDAAFDRTRLDELEIEPAPQYHVYSDENATLNIGITQFRTRTNLDSDRDFEGIVAVKNFDNQPHKVNVLFHLDDVFVEEQSLELAAGEEKLHVFSKTLYGGGLLKAELEFVKDENAAGAAASDGRIEGADRFALDDVAWEVIPMPMISKVLLFSQEKRSFLESVLSANTNIRAYRLDEAKSAGDYDVDAVIYYDTPLPEALPDSHIVYINPKSRKAPKALLERIETPLVKGWNRNHPLMNYISLDNLLLARAWRVNSLDSLLGVPSDHRIAQTVIAESTSGPLILAGEHGRQKIVFMGFDPRESDLPFRVAFPVLVSNAVLWFQEDEKPKLTAPVKPGEPHTIEVSQSSTKELAIKDPSGNEHQVEIFDGRAVFIATGKCGAYQYELNGRKESFTVNLSDATESSISPLFEGETADEKETTQEQHGGKKIWPYLASLLLCGLVIESFLFHRRILF